MGASTTTSELTTTTESTAPTTEAPRTTVTTRRLPGLGVGARGPAVLDLERKLDALRFDVGPIDGVYDGTTAHAVTAFQKVHGMKRTARATDDVVARVASTTGTPPPLVPGGGATRVEVDLPRQVLFLYQGDQIFKILPVSTGNNERFCVEGRCERAVTPGGSFRIYRRAGGWEKSPLGLLYNSQYFNAGVAIHGAPSVPPYPASHGCVRIPMSAAEWFPSKVSIGTPVYVAGGPKAPAPFANVPPVSVTAPPTTSPPSPPPSTTRLTLPPLTMPATTSTSSTTRPTLAPLTTAPRNRSDSGRRDR